MIARPIERELLDEVSRLSEPDLRRVLEFARSLPRSTPWGEPPSRLLSMVGLIPSVDLAEMSRAIEEGCEQVDPDAF